MSRAILPARSSSNNSYAPFKNWLSGPARLDKWKTTWLSTEYSLQKAKPSSGTRGTSLCTYVWVNSSREHFPPPRANPRAYPEHLKKLFKCPDLRAILVGKCPALRSFCGGQMPGPPVHPINIQSYWLPYFDKHNCFSSIELHKTGHEMSHFDWKMTKQMVLLLLYVFYGR